MPRFPRREQNKERTNEVFSQASPEDGNFLMSERLPSRFKVRKLDPKKVAEIATVLDFSQDE